mmetsp:Transcript_81507/g.218071  ORF Transcript_81507/g.218071 Transcript_81507/m.218071 type:complete len:449 (-) Transcript_81507:442-1788(-)
MKKNEAPKPALHEGGRQARRTPDFTSQTKKKILRRGSNAIPPARAAKQDSPAGPREGFPAGPGRGQSRKASRLAPQHSTHTTRQQTAAPTRTAAGSTKKKTQRRAAALPLEHGHGRHHVEGLALDVHKSRPRNWVAVLEALHKIETAHPQRCFAPGHGVDDAGVPAVLLRRRVRRSGLAQVLCQRTHLAIHCSNDNPGPRHRQSHDGVPRRSGITHGPEERQGRHVPAQHRPAGRARVDPGAAHSHSRHSVVLVSRRHLQHLLAPEAVVKAAPLDLGAVGCEDVLRVPSHEGVRGRVARGVQSDRGLGRSALAVPPNHLQILCGAQQPAALDKRQRDHLRRVALESRNQLLALSAGGVPHLDVERAGAARPGEDRPRVAIRSRCHHVLTQHPRPIQVPDFTDVLVAVSVEHVHTGRADTNEQNRPRQLGRAGYKACPKSSKRRVSRAT